MSVAVLVPLALTQTPSHDDFYTLEYARQPTLDAVVDLHATSRNSTPLPPYVLFWAWGRVVGTSFAALALLSVGAWAALTLAIGRLLRGLRPRARLVGALAPTLSPLAYLGIAARGYAVALALLAWTTVVAEGAAAPDADRRRVVLAAALAFGACVLQYPAALYVVFLAGWIAVRRATCPAGLGLPAALVLVAALATIPQLGTASAAAAYGADLDQAGTTWWSGLLTQASLARTWWPLLAVLAPIAATAGRRRPHDVDGWGRWPSARFCLVTAVALPALAAVPFAVVGAAFHHRYAASALIATSLLIGWATESTTWSGRRAAVLLGPPVVLSLALSVHAIRSLSPSWHQVERFRAELDVDSAPAGPVYVADQRAFLLLRERSADHRPWVLTTGQPTPIGQDQRGAIPASGRRVVVAAVGPEWSRIRSSADDVDGLGTATLSYHGKSVRYVAVVLS